MIAVDSLTNCFEESRAAMMSNFSLELSAHIVCGLPIGMGFKVLFYKFVDDRAKTMRSFKNCDEYT